LLGDTNQVEPERKNQKKQKKEIKTSQIGTKEKETRATFIVNEDLLENEIVGLLG
jgi:hypothetical protein